MMLQPRPGNWSRLFFCGRSVRYAECFQILENGKRKTENRIQESEYSEGGSVEVRIQSRLRDYQFRTERASRNC
jgi:hypothetical protein